MPEKAGVIVRKRVQLTVVIAAFVSMAALHGCGDSTTPVVSDSVIHDNQGPSLTHSANPPCIAVTNRKWYPWTQCQCSNCYIDTVRTYDSGTVHRSASAVAQLGEEQFGVGWRTYGATLSFKVTAIAESDVYAKKIAVYGSDYYACGADPRIFWIDDNCSNPTLITVINIPQAGKYSVPITGYFRKFTFKDASEFYNENGQVSFAIAGVRFTTAH